jgi:hypothetical protein
MDKIVAAFFMVSGLVGIFYPGFFYKSELLTSEQIARNKRIWKLLGIAFLGFGIIKAVVILF